jgi:hypothetical protein
MITYLEKVETLLDMPPAEKADVLRELGSHILDVRNDLIASGMSENEAQTEAESRMGHYSDVAARLSIAHNTASWPSALLTAAPCLAAALVLMLRAVIPAAFTIALIALIGLVTSVGTVRELVRGHRPVWLSSWMAASMLCVAGMVRSVVGADPKASIVSGLLLVAATSIAAYRGGRWLPSTAIMAAIYLSCSVYLLLTKTEDVLFLPTLACIGILAVMIIMLARLVFEFHPYSDGTRASLFILTVSSLGALTTASGRPSPYELALVLAIGGLVACFARASSRQMKITVLSLSCLALAFIGALDEPSLKMNGLVGDVISVAVSTGLRWLMLRYFWVGLPRWPDERYLARAKPPTVA